MIPARKVAFVHYAKAAGRYVDHYLRTQVWDSGMDEPAEQECKIFNSWEPPFDLERDWTAAELRQLANNRHPTQYPTPDQVRRHHEHWSHDYLARQYVHNHHRSWSRETVQEFRRNGWLTFMFIRDPGELLCSLWTWARHAVAAGADAGRIIRPSHLAALPLDAFIGEILATPALHGFYALPDYTEEIDQVAEFTGGNFERLLLRHFGHRYHPERIAAPQRHASGNPGYAAYRRQGLISEETHRMLEADDDANLVRRRLGSADC